MTLAQAITRGIARPSRKGLCHMSQGLGQRLQHLTALKYLVPESPEIGNPG